MKSLIMNFIEFAKYEIDGNRIYIKMLVQVFENNVEDSETLLICIISKIEGVEFKEAAYLNV